MVGGAVGIGVRKGLAQIEDNCTTISDEKPDEVSTNQKDSTSQKINRSTSGENILRKNSSICTDHKSTPIHHVLCCDHVAVPVSVALSIILMHYTKTMHPAAVGTALSLVVGPKPLLDLGWEALIPVFLGSSLIVVTGIIGSRLVGRRYPVRWF